MSTASGNNVSGGCTPYQYVVSICSSNLRPIERPGRVEHFILLMRVICDYVFLCRWIPYMHAAIYLVEDNTLSIGRPGHKIYPGRRIARSKHFLPRSCTTSAARAIRVPSGDHAILETAIDILPEGL